MSAFPPLRLRITEDLSIFEIVEVLNRVIMRWDEVFFLFRGEPQKERGEVLAFMLLFFVFVCVFFVGCFFSLFFWWVFIPLS